MIIRKPKIEDLDKIGQILKQWTDQEEVEKYLFRIKSEIDGYTEYSMNFWVGEDNGTIICISGLSNPLPIILSLAKSKNPGEIKIFYVDNNHRGKGIGRQMINFLEEEAKNQGYAELFVRSAERYKDTGHGFYEKMKYEFLGRTENNMAIFHRLLS